MSDPFRKLELKSKKKKKTIILPESFDPRVREAVKRVLKNKTAKVILINSGKKFHFEESNDLDIIDIGFSVQFTSELLKIRKSKNKKYTYSDAEKELKDPLVFSCMLLKYNFADAVVAGSVYSTGSVIRSGLKIIGLSSKNKTVSSFFLLSFPAGHKLYSRVIAFADCGVLPDPNASQLSDIAIQTSLNYKKLTGIKPKTAFLSFSTKGSAKGPAPDKIIEAYRLTKKRAPNLICDGELQFDTAFVPEVAKRKDPGGNIKGDANVFIFPDLNSGNIAYKIAERIGGAIATGPIVQGLAKPVMDLSRGCSPDDIYNMILIASQF
jgi:phosphate acetyltransferase